MAISETRSGVEPLVEEPIKLKQGENYPQYDIIRSILKLYNNNNLLFSAEVSYRKLKALVSLLVCPSGFAIIQYIVIVGAFTKPELVDVLALSWPRVNAIVNELETYGLIKKYGKVGAPYKPKGGRPVPIYGLLDIDPELMNEAQRRYGDTRGNHVSPEIEPEIVNEIVNLFMKRENPGASVDHRTIENIIKQPKMKIPPTQRAEYSDRVSHKLVEKGIEVN